MTGMTGGISNLVGRVHQLTQRMEEAHDKARGDQWAEKYGQLLTEYKAAIKLLGVLDPEAAAILRQEVEEELRKAQATPVRNMDEDLERDRQVLLRLDMREAFESALE